MKKIIIIFALALCVLPNSFLGMQEQEPFPIFDLPEFVQNHIAAYVAANWRKKIIRHIQAQLNRQRHPSLATTAIDGRECIPINNGSILTTLTPAFFINQELHRLYRVDSFEKDGKGNIEGTIIGTFAPIELGVKKGWYCTAKSKFCGTLSENTRWLIARQETVNSNNRCFALCQVGGNQQHRNVAFTLPEPYRSSEFMLAVSNDGRHIANVFQPNRGQNVQEIMEQANLPQLLAVLSTETNAVTHHKIRNRTNECNCITIFENFVCYQRIKGNRSRKTHPIYTFLLDEPADTKPMLLENRLDSIKDHATLPGILRTMGVAAFKKPKPRDAKQDR